MFQEMLKNLFPSWKAVSYRYREVIIFSAGLMKDPKPLVQFVYEMQVEHYLRHRSMGHPSIDADLFKYFNTEATVPLPDHPLHNKFLNHYNHREDDRKKRPRDTTPIYFLSRVYHFKDMREAVVLENHLSAPAQTPNCAMYIWYPDKARDVLSHVLLVCSEIFKQQPVTDLHMWGINCHDSSLPAPRMINPQHLELAICDLPDQFVRSLIQQLFEASDSLQELRLHEINFRPYESLLDELLENLVAHHETQKGQRELYLNLWLFEINLSGDFCERWRERCEGVESINCDIYP